MTAAKTSSDERWKYGDLIASVLLERIRVRAMCAQLVAEGGLTLLLVEQNALMALEVAERGYVLQTGTIALHDDAAALMKNEMIRQVYLGEQ